MKKTYTERYLIQDITNKAFRLRYGTTAKSKNKPRYCKTKKERRKWWRNLTPDQQASQIEKWQAIKAKKRKYQPKRVLRYNPEYPWMTEGVNEGNRKQWQKMIAKKNPWLKVA